MATQKEERRGKVPQGYWCGQPARCAFHAGLSNVSTTNVLYSSIKRNNKTYLKEKDSDLNPSSSCTDSGDQPSHPGSTAYWAVPMAQAAPPQAGARGPSPLTQAPLQRWAGGGRCSEDSSVFPGMYTVVEMKGFSDSWFKMTWWNTQRARTRWTRCSQALRTEVPKMNFFPWYIVYFPMWCESEDRGLSQSQDFKNPESW